MTDLYREVLENIMMRIQAFTPEQKEYYQNLGTRIYELYSVHGLPLEMGFKKFYQLDAFDDKIGTLLFVVSEADALAREDKITSGASEQNLDKYRTFCKNRLVKIYQKYQTTRDLRQVIDTMFQAKY